MKKFSKLLILILTPLLIWTLTFKLVIGLVLLILYITSIILIKKEKILLFYTILALSVTMFIVMLPLTMVQINLKQERYNKAIQEGVGLTFIEKFNVYGLHAVMVSTGVFIYPEVSIASALMMLPHSKNTILSGNNTKHRTINGLTFFKKSKKLMTVLNSSNNGHFAWKLNDYRMNSDESRVALALNPVDYEVIKNNNKLTYKLTVPVHYCKGIDVLYDSKYIKIQIREELFKYLAKEKWLYPYWLTYNYSETKN